MGAGWEPVGGSYPSAPHNPMAVSPYVRGAWDLHWDPPSALAANAQWTVLGVNIYRSTASDRGPYFRVNSLPISGGFYRDQTELVPVEGEVITWDPRECRNSDDWITRGDSPRGRYRFYTQHPIYKRLLFSPDGQPVFADSYYDVVVRIDGVVVPVDSVFGRGHQVTLINSGYWDTATDKAVPARLPTEDSVVEVDYWTLQNNVPSGLDRNIFYRFTTVALDPDDPYAYRETPLEYAEPITTAEVEKMDWIWREAVRRNNWILEQGGERIKVFIKKTSGIRCDCCRDLRTLEYTKQPSSSCLTCFGTGFVGGYEGPYDLTIAPDDAERRLRQGVLGRNKEHTYEVWSGPTPLLTQRDFIAKQTNERYSVGAVRRPTCRGMMLQQHFTIGYFDEPDIRYEVPLDGISDITWPETRYGISPTKAVGQMSAIAPPWPVGSNNPPFYTPQGTEKDNIPDEREHRGRTPVYENTEY